MITAKLKVPESAHMRIELNKIDSAGLDNAEALRSLLQDESTVLSILMWASLKIDVDNHLVMM